MAYSTYHATERLTLLGIIAQVSSVPYSEDHTCRQIDKRCDRMLFLFTHCLQVRVLLKEPKGREVSDGDRFTYNAGLTEKLYRIKINSIQVVMRPQKITTYIFRFPFLLCFQLDPFNLVV